MRNADCGIGKKLIQGDEDVETRGRPEPRGVQGKHGDAGRGETGIRRIILQMHKWKIRRFAQAVEAQQRVGVFEQVCPTEFVFTSTERWPKIIKRIGA
jgi:hypothetical protein